MKTTTIPAQITTVEDKIAGNLNLTQMILLTTPIFLGGALYIIFPPFLKLSAFKTAVFVILCVNFLILSLRVKGKLLLEWIVIKSRFNLRPRYYIFNKNDNFLRTDVIKKQLIQTKVSKKPESKVLNMPELSVPKLIQLQSAISSPNVNLSFSPNKKGGLNVRITEIE